MPEMEAKSQSVESAIDVNTNQVMSDTMITIAEHLIDVAHSFDPQSVDEFAVTLNEANRIFVMGAGRSGLVAKSFAMRLMHIGYEVYVVGEIVTPAVAKGDAVVAISGSGNTRTISEFGDICKKLDVKLVTVTSNRDSALGRLSDLVVLVDTKQRRQPYEKDYMERQLSGHYKSLTPMGTVFELTSSVFLDAFVAKLMVIRGVNETDLKKNHAVLE